MAIVAVMWIVAALALLVVGMAAGTRADIRAAQVARAEAEATAYGDAAIQLAVLELRSASEPLRIAATQQYEFEGRAIEVDVRPVEGYIDLNNANPTLLRDLFLIGAGLSEEEAEALTQRLTDWRDADQSALPLGAENEAYLAAGSPNLTRGEQLTQPEDLLQILGMTLDVYDKIEHFVTVFGANGVDPKAATPGVLAILAKGNIELASKIAAARDSGDPAIDMTGLEQAHLAVASGTRYRIAARLQADGRVMSRVRWVDVAEPGPLGLPWRTLRVEPPRGEPPPLLQPEN
ncbi:MAG: general secretion pathway protein GspK [Burkholderiaceae bacterium]